MNKRKLMLVAVALCMVAILGFGGTLAYLTDTETATNVFTTGNVDIKLIEDFEPNSKLMPGTKEQNNVKKVVTVENTGSEEAYVRVHIAIPAILNSGDDDHPAQAALNNSLHFNFPTGSTAEGYWSWSESVDTPNVPTVADDWHMYQIDLPNGDKTVTYDVYVVTYETALAPKGKDGATTAVAAMHQVYLDAKLNNDDMQEILDTIGDIKILVAAEAVQKAGFDNAYEAFQAAVDTKGTDGNANLPYKTIFNAMLDYTGKVEYDNEADYAE